MGNIQVVSYAIPFKSASNKGAGLAINKGDQGVRITSLGWSWTDTQATPTFNPGTNIFQARVAIIENIFADDPVNFTVAYDLSPYRVLLDEWINDPGPSNYPMFFGDEEDQIASQAGYPISILFSAGVAVGVPAAQMVGKFRVGSAEIPSLRMFGRQGKRTLAGVPSGQAAAGGGFSGGFGGGGFSSGGGHHPL